MFILALIVLTAATTILALTVASQRVSSKAAINRMEARRARMMAESGVQRGIAELILITQPGLVDQNQTWFTLGNKGEDEFQVGGESFRMQIVDAGSLLNLNTVTELQLQNLNLTQAQVDSLLDWREPGETPRAEGAKNDYYNSLDKPYNARLGRLESLDEVLLVKDWIPDTVYQVPTTSSTSNLATTKSLYQLFTVDSFAPNTDPSGQALQNINNAQVQQLTQAGLTAQVAQAIVARRGGLGTFTSLNQVFTTPGLDTRAAEIVLNRFSIGGAARIEGKLNINTATEETLSRLTDMTSDVAQAIVSHQTTGFATLGEVTQIPGVTVQLLSQIANQITVGSDTFIVRCEGRAGQTRVAIEAVVRVENGSARVIKTLEPPQNLMAELWEWPTEASNQTVLGEDRRQ